MDKGTSPSYNIRLTYDRNFGFKLLAWLDKVSYVKYMYHRVFTWLLNLVKLQFVIHGDELTVCENMLFGVTPKPRCHHKT